MEHEDQTPSTRDIAGGGAQTQAPAEEAPRFDRETRGPGDENDALMPTEDQGGFIDRWEEIQTRFVDDPRRAVEDADALVASVMKRLADGFAEERERLEGMWGRGEDVGTEDLRVALQRYRSFFRRLLTA